MPPRRRRSRLVLLAMVALALAAAAEGAVRARQWMRYGVAGGTLHVLVEDPASGLQVPRPGVVEGREHRIEIDSHGFRNPELELPKPAGRRRIAFLGGSTTFCAEATRNGTTWPQLVRDGLGEAFPGVALDYVNAGVGGYSVEQSLVNLERRVAPTAPDVIVIYHATNDLAAGTREVARQQGLVGAAAHEPTWLARHSLAWGLLEKNVLAWWRGGAADGARAVLDPDPSVHAARFERQLERLVDRAASVAPVVVLVTFSHAARREQDADTQRARCASSLYYMPYMSVEGILAGFEAYNDAIRRVARRRGAVLVEGEHSIAGDERHFADSVHLTDAGCRAQADRILDVLRRSPEVAAALGGPP